MIKEMIHEMNRNELIEQGYSEEDAEKCADFMFSDEWQSEE